MNFSDIFIDDTKNVKRINSDEYLIKGNISVIDQGKELIAGYASDDVENACYDTRIVFGDHTRIFKYIDFPFVCGADGTKVLKIIDPSKINYKYMYYYLLASNIPNTGYNRHFKWVKELSFKPVDINSQMLIVNKLDKINNLIDCRKKEIEKCDNLIKSQFVEMFGDPLVNDGMFEMKLIKQIGKVVSGATPKTNNDEFWNGNNIWVTPAELNDNSFVISDSERKITDLGVKSCAVNLLPKNTVILSSRAPIGKTAIAGVDMYCNQGFKNIIPSNEINSIYLYELLKNKTEYLNSLGRGATFKEISKEIVENIKIKVPPIVLQNKFAQIVEQIDKQKFVNLKIFQLLGKKLKKCYNSIVDFR